MRWDKARSCLWALFLSDHVGASPFASVGDWTPAAAEEAEDHWPKATLNLQTYKTDPQYKSVSFRFTNRTEDESLLSPGFFFLTMSVMLDNHAHQGAQIYDDKGNLVWHDLDKRSQDLKVCDYLGEEGTHLSAFTPDDKYSYFLDQTYSLKPGKYHGLNGHEFNVLPGGEQAVRLETITKAMDLRPYTGQKKGWVLDVCLLEVDIRSTAETFRWCPLDHIPIWHTRAFLMPNCLEGPPALAKVNASMRTRKAGCSGEGHPWDYTHGNAADKYDGDYLYCSRFLDQIIKIAGPDNRHGVKPGTILWRLGGLYSDFEQDFNFTRQHHARFVSVSGNETVISLFNNAWEGTSEPSARTSDGQIVKINNDTMKATLVQRYSPPHDILSEGRGSTQILANGNVLVGYGRSPEFTEHSADGTILLHAQVSEFPFKLFSNLAVRTHDFSYRTFKFPWVGRPKQPPALIAYSRSCTTSKKSPLIAYVSWNGATEVVTWRFFLSSTTVNGPWAPVGDFAKTGYETVAHLSSKAEAQLLRFTPFVMVQGLSASGHVLGSQIVTTFVPARPHKHKCDEYGCNKPEDFTYEPSLATTCDAGRLLPGYIALGMLVVMLEICYHLCRSLSTHLDEMRFGHYTPVIEIIPPADKPTAANTDDLKKEEN